MPVDKFGRSNIGGGICPSSTGGNLKILNYNGHIPPLPVSKNSTGFYPTASSEKPNFPAVLAFNPINVSALLSDSWAWVANTLAAD